MHLLPSRDIEISPSDRVFRHARLLASIIWLAAFAGVVAMFFYAYTTKNKVGYFFGPFVLVFLLLTIRFVTARFHPSNWLVRTNDNGMYIQYRSYLNYQLPADEPSVVFISYGEIASARLVKERLHTPDPANPRTTQTQFLRYVELELSGDTSLLAQALQTEQGEAAPMEKHWYGKSSTLYQDYPVSMGMPPLLRIRWDVVPRAHKFLDALRPYTPILDTVSLKQDFTHLQSLSREEQQKKLRDLANRGQTMTAIYTARRLYNCGLAQAKDMVDNLQRGDAGAPPERASVRTFRGHG